MEQQIQLDLELLHYMIDVKNEDNYSCVVNNLTYIKESTGVACSKCKNLRVFHLGETERLVCGARTYNHKYGLE